jgi:hypothetical protein
MDPTSEFDPDVNPSDVREQCRKAIDRAAQRSYEPTTGGWARLRYSATLHSPEWEQLVLWMACLVFVSLISARLIGTNTFSLHSMYCNRLVRVSRSAAPVTGLGRPIWETALVHGSDCADNSPIGAASSGGHAGHGTNARLLHVLNAPDQETAKHRPEWQQRRANFHDVASGGRRVGYVRSITVRHRHEPRRAMAISAAASRTWDITRLRSSRS